MNKKIFYSAIAYEHCCKINAAITKFNNKNGRNILPTSPCDEYFMN